MLQPKNTYPKSRPVSHQLEDKDGEGWDVESRPKDSLSLSQFYSSIIDKEKSYILEVYNLMFHVHIHCEMITEINKLTYP